MGRSQKMRRALRAAALVTALVAGTSDRGPVERAPAEPPYVTFFLFDGLSQQVFEEELAAGNLPELQRLVNEGTYVKDGIASFPSMTAYGFYPFITGHDAAKSGVLGLRWFDAERDEGSFRAYVGLTSRWMNEDFVPQPLTVYEHFGHEHSHTINSYANRGVESDTKFGLSFSLAKYEGKWWLSDFLRAVPGVGGTLAPDWIGAERRVMATAMGDLPRRPKVQWITLTSPDGYQHVHGTTDTYRQILRDLDGLIGEYRRESERLGQESHRIYAIISDHGVENVDDNLDMRSVFERCCQLKAYRGKATKFLSVRLDEPIESYDPFDVVTVINGNLLLYVYVRDHGEADPKRTWRRRLGADELRHYRRADGSEVDLIAAMLAEPGIDHVLCRGEGGRVDIVGMEGTARVEPADGGWRYRVTDGRDPLGYQAHPPAAALMDGQAHSARAWLEATHASGFPDGVVRIGRLFATDHAGDMVLLSARGYDFGKDYEAVVGNYRGGHGGLRADQMRVPYILSGPGVTKGAKVPVARAEDLGRTLLDLLGVSTAPSTLSGKTIDEAMAP